MSDVVEFYTQQAKNNQSNLAWLAQLQTKASEHFTRLGFPMRHDEEWKYTPVDSFTKQTFSQHQDRVIRTIQTDIPIKNQIQIINGQYLENIDLNLPAGVLVMPLAKALQEHSDLLQPYLGQILEEEHGFHALNTAMIDSGVFIYIPKKICLEEPLAIVHYQDQSNQAVYLRHLIIAEPESMATVIEEYHGEDQHTYATNAVTEIHMGKHAQLNHYKIQRESKAAFHMGHLAIQQNAYSDFSSHALNLGGKLVRSDLSIYLKEEYARCLMNGIYAPGEGQHIDHHTTVNHLVPNCQSEQDYKGILKGRSRAVFNGKVKVANDAQHTDAQQQNKNLLLSQNAEINTKPQLEIFAHDVICSHGATVGQLDEEALFYLATRGIDRAEASQYLIHAFANDNLRRIPQPELAAWMGQLLTEQVG